MDTLSSHERSERMGRIRSKHTKPELAVRRLVHSLGKRYRLHGIDLPGCPDLVFSSYGKVILVHGCYWHRHKGCPHTRLPKSRLDFWRPKLEANAVRDAKNVRKLRALGWGVMVIWECQVAKREKIATRIKRFLQ